MPTRMYFKRGKLKVELALAKGKQAAVQNGNVAVELSINNNALRNQSQISNTAVRRVQNRSEAEDLTSDVFRRALEHLPHFELRGVPFGAWLFRIASNVIGTVPISWPTVVWPQSRAGLKSKFSKTSNGP